MTFIHDLTEWPHLRWNLAALAQPLASVRHHQGRLLGRMESLGFDVRAEANLVSLTTEVVNTSAIEGETLATEDVRSSIARRLGMEMDVVDLPTPSRAVDGIVVMMLDATQRCHLPLTDERLFGWHAELLPLGRSGRSPLTVGAWRTAAGGPMQVVSGEPGRERVHFQAPDAQRVADEMRQFLAWFAGCAELDPVLKAAVAHVWFVTIHPFDEGNGRIARAIAGMALAQADGIPERFYSMSACIEAERKEYYIQLESAQRGSTDITAWIAWFLGCLERTIRAAETALATVLRKARVWQSLAHASIIERQRMALNRMLDDWKGHMTSSKYAILTKCSADTAQRDLRQLVACGALIQNPAGGRSTSFRLAEDPGVAAPQARSTI